jgi:hypothetical protein
MPSAETGAWNLFVAVADTLADDFEILGFLESFTSSCSLLLAVDVALLLPTDPRAEHDVATASSESAHRLLLAELRGAAGPTMECYQTASPLHSDDIQADAPRWPAFSRAAADEGFTACHSIPMRRRRQVIGAISFLTTDPAALEPDQVSLAQALTDVATIGLIEQRSRRGRAAHVAQLQTALDSRIVIEQAKGILAERLRTTLEESFALLRGHARSNNATLRDTARAVVDGTLRIPALPSGIQTKPLTERRG